MFNFIKTTSEVILKEIPNVFITNVNYSCEDGVMIMRVHFYDANFDTKGFQFMYYEVPNPLNAEDGLVLEFTSYLNKNIKPIFKQDKK